MRQLPLSKVRLWELLSLYEGRVAIEEVGGYDMGVYFRFAGRLHKRFKQQRQVAGGRLAGVFGFGSKAICITPRERFGRGVGLQSFTARVSRRHSTLQRWLAEFYEHASSFRRERSR